MSGDEVRVEPSDVRVTASKINAEWSAAPSNPIPPCGLRLAGLAIAQLNASAAEVTAHLKSGEAEATRLSQSFMEAARVYGEVDDAARAALESGVNPSIPPIPISPDLSPPVPIPADLPARPDSPEPTFLDVYDAATQIQQPDQATSLDSFETAWSDYAASLDARADSLTMPPGWEGAAAEAAGNSLKSHQDWLHKMAETCRKLSEQAGEVAEAHRAAVAEHPTVAEVQAVRDRIQHAMDAAEGKAAIAEYAALQAKSEQVLGAYAVKAYSAPINSPDVPTGAPKMGSVSENGDPRKAPKSGQDPAGTGAGQGGGAGGGQPGGGQPGASPLREESPGGRATPQPAAASSGGGSPSGGGGAPSGGGGGAPSGGGAPGGGLPAGLPGGLPGGGPDGLPPIDDPALKPAAASGGGGAGGGAGGGGGGGGVPPSPLQPAVGADSVAPGPAGARGGAVAGAGPAGAAGPMGGMGGMPMGGAGAGRGGQGGERKRTPGLSPDEELYVEDRPFTESIIGYRSKAPERKDEK